jgi:hypothetical protein
LIDGKYSRNATFYLDHALAAGNYSVELIIDKSKQVYTPFPAPTSAKNASFLIKIKRSVPVWRLNKYTVSLEQHVDMERQRVINKITFDYNMTITYDAASLPSQITLNWLDSFFLSDRSTYDNRYALKLGEANQQVFINASQSLLVVGLRKSFTLIDNNLDDQDLMSRVYGIQTAYAFLDESDVCAKLRQFESPLKERINLKRVLTTLNLTYFGAQGPIEYSYGAYNVPVLMRIRNQGPLRIADLVFDVFAVDNTRNIKLKEIKIENTLNVDDTFEHRTILQVNISLEFLDTS